MSSREPLGLCPSMNFNGFALTLGGSLFDPLGSDSFESMCAVLPVGLENHVTVVVAWLTISDSAPDTT